MNITDYIVECLQQGKTVEIPGIGVWSSVVEQAHFDEQSATFYPTRRITSFSDKCIGNEEFVNYIAETECVDGNVAKQIVRNYADALSEKLNNEGEVNIAGIGKIGMQGGGLSFNVTEMPEMNHDEAMPISRVKTYEVDPNYDPFAAATNSISTPVAKPTGLEAIKEASEVTGNPISNIANIVGGEEVLTGRETIELTRKEARENEKKLKEELKRIEKDKKDKEREAREAAIKEQDEQKTATNEPEEYANEGLESPDYLTPSIATVAAVAAPMAALDKQAEKKEKERLEKEAKEERKRLEKEAKEEKKRKEQEAKEEKERREKEAKEEKERIEKEEKEAKKRKEQEEKEEKERLDKEAKEEKERRDRELKEEKERREKEEKEARKRKEQEEKEEKERREKEAKEEKERKEQEAKREKEEKAHIEEESKREKAEKEKQKKEELEAKKNEEKQAKREKEEKEKLEKEKLKFQKEQEKQAKKVQEEQEKLDKKAKKEEEKRNKKALKAEKKAQKKAKKAKDETMGIMAEGQANEQKKTKKKSKAWLWILIVLILILLLGCAAVYFGKPDFVKPAHDWFFSNVMKQEPKETTELDIDNMLTNSSQQATDNNQQTTDNRQQPTASNPMFADACLFSFSEELTEFSPNEIDNYADAINEYLSDYISNYLAAKKYTTAKVPMMERIRQYSVSRLSELLNANGYSEERLIPNGDYISDFIEPYKKGHKGHQKQVIVQGEIMDGSFLDNMLNTMVEELGLKADNAKVQLPPDLPKVKPVIKTERKSRQGFDLIAGFYTDVNTAQKMVDRLKGYGCNAYIIEINHGYYVSMDSAKSRTEADARLRKAKEWYDGDLSVKSF